MSINEQRKADLSALAPPSSWNFRTTSKTKGSGGVSAGCLAPAGETTGLRARAERAGVPLPGEPTLSPDRRGSQARRAAPGRLHPGETPLWARRPDPACSPQRGPPGGCRARSCRAQPRVSQCWHFDFGGCMRLRLGRGCWKGVSCASQEVFSSTAGLCPLDARNTVLPPTHSPAL